MGEIKRLTRITINNIKKIIFGFGNINEYSFSEYPEDYEKLLFTGNCKTVCDLLSRNGIDVSKFAGVQKKSCGIEGCAYFYGDKVLKCTLESSEWETATALKSVSKQILPVIDTDFDKDAKVYLILMLRLDTNRSKEISDLLDEAGGFINGWLGSRRIKSIDPKNTKEISRVFDIQAFRFFADSYPEYKKLSPKDKQLVDGLFELVILIYKKSGYVLSTDIRSDNVGFQGEVPQLLDFGSGEKFGLRKR